MQHPLEDPSCQSALTICCLADNRTCVTGSRDGRIRIWDFLTCRYIGILGVHDAPVFCLALCPDGQTVASFSDDGTLKLYDAVCLEYLDEFAVSPSVVALAFASPDVLLTAVEDLGVIVYSLPEGNEIMRFSAEPHEFVSSVHFEPGT